MPPCRCDVHLISQLPAFSIHVRREWRSGPVFFYKRRRSAPFFLLCFIIPHSKRTSRTRTCTLIINQTYNLLQAPSSISPSNHADLTMLTTLALAAIALGSCPNGPYTKGSDCGGACIVAERCSDHTDEVVRTSIHLLYPKSSGFYDSPHHFSPPSLTYSCIYSTLCLDVG